MTLTSGAHLSAGAAEESASGLVEEAGPCARGELGLLRGPRGREGEKKLGRAKVTGLKMFYFFLFSKPNKQIQLKFKLKDLNSN